MELKTFNCFTMRSGDHFIAAYADTALNTHVFTSKLSMVPSDIGLDALIYLCSDITKHDVDSKLYYSDKSRLFSTPCEKCVLRADRRHYNPQTGVREVKLSMLTSHYKKNSETGLPSKCVCIVCERNNK